MSSFVVKSRETYLNIISDNIKNKINGSIGIFGVSCSAKLIYDFIRHESNAAEVVFVATRPIEKQLIGMPVKDINDAYLKELDMIILSSISNQAGQEKALIDSGFTGEILRLPEVPYISTCMTYDPCDYMELEEISNKNVGKPAFVIGNGPSLLTTKPSKIPQNFIKFGCNGIVNNMDFNIDYYFALDGFSILSWESMLLGLKSKFIFPAHLKSSIDNSNIKHRDILYYPVCYRKNTEDSDYVNYLSNGFETNHTVVSVMIQFCAVMGCNPIYIIGVDLNYKGDNIYAMGNYHPVGTPAYKDDFIDYFTEQMMLGIARSVSACNRNGISIYNCSRKSRLYNGNIVPYMDFDRVLEGFYN